MRDQGTRAMAQVDHSAAQRCRLGKQLRERLGGSGVELHRLWVSHLGFFWEAVAQDPSPGFASSRG